MEISGNEKKELTLEERIATLEKNMESFNEKMTPIYSVLKREILIEEVKNNAARDALIKDGWKVGQYFREGGAILYKLSL